MTVSVGDFDNTVTINVEEYFFSILDSSLANKIPFELKIYRIYGLVGYFGLVLHIGFEILKMNKYGRTGRASKMVDFKRNGMES